MAGQGVSRAFHLLAQRHPLASSPGASPWYRRKLTEDTTWRLRRGSRPVGRVSDGTFSLDSRRWGYIAQNNQQKYAVISGASHGPYDFLSVTDEEACIYFSPDSRQFAFMATRDYIRNNYRNGREYLVVDGREYGTQGASWLSGSVLRFDSPARLHGLVMRKDRLAQSEIEIRPD
jgi:hypothetical protein